MYSFQAFKYLLLGLIAVGCANTDQQEAPAVLDHTAKVNPFIGTGGHGHTFPGATVPFGMVQLSPDTRRMGWDACAGYHHSDSSILGFSHTHLSGTGIGDYGDVLFMPYSGDVPLTRGEAEDPDSGYRSRFSHDQEEAVPGYYSVDLLDDNIKVELTASTRVGFHRYTFQEAGAAGVLIDLTHTIHGGWNHDQGLRVISDTEIVGYKKSGGWAHDQRVFFYAKFDKPFTAQFYNEDTPMDGQEAEQLEQLKAKLTFNVAAGETVLVKVGISPVDQDGALGNLQSEVDHWDFEKVRQEAHDQWVQQLATIDVEGGESDDQVIFYTALYHTSISPNIFTDVDGRYRGMDGMIHASEGEAIYTVFSFWDTFRALHPLLTIIDPERNQAFIRSIIDKYDQGGMLPKWELAGNYTGTMIGYHAIPVIVDAYMKGQRDFDVEKAYEAMLVAASYDTAAIRYPNPRTGRLMSEGKKYHADLDYIPADVVSRSVSRALEYAYNDWCIAQMARDLGKMEDYEHFMERSRLYSKYYDEQTGFMRGKLEDGSWREPFNPRFYSHRHDDYTEGNAFQWSYFAPHDIEGLAALMGGEGAFTAKLDTLFTTSSELVGEEVSGDISGMIGQYAHGNEPSHHMSHIYNFVGQPWKTQALSDQILKELYFNDPNGLSGNEDCGQMSAWYLLSAMGFYSFCPGDPTYSVGRPLFDEVRIHRAGAGDFIISTKDNSPENKYVQSVKLKGELLTQPFFAHEDIERGGLLEFVMGAEPAKQTQNAGY